MPHSTRYGWTVRWLSRLGGGVLVLTGYGLVAVASQIEYWGLGGTLNPEGMFTLETTLTASYLIVGVAWLIHLRAIVPRPGSARTVRWTMLLFAIASALLTVGWAVELRDFIVGPSAIPTDVIVSFALTASGYAVVFVGFFLAGRLFGKGEAQHVTTELDAPSGEAAPFPVPYETV